MTFQPPPPPPPPPPGPPAGGPPAGGPPPGQWGPPPGQGPSGAGGFDPKSVDMLDWGIIAAGVLAFLFSFISYYSGVDVTYHGHTQTIDAGSASAWNDVFGGGFFGWFAMLFAILGAVVTALGIFQPNVKLPVTNRLLTVYLFVAAAVFEIIAIFVTPGDSYLGADASANHGAGFWLSLIVVLAGAVLALMRAQQTGTAMPGPLNNIPKIGK